MYVNHNENKRLWAAFGQSLQEVERWLEVAPKRWATMSAARTPASRDWDLEAGMAGARHLARFGWREGAENLSTLLQAGDVETSKQNVQRWDIAGFEPDIGRFMAGDPAHMRRRSRVAEIVREPIVQIAYNITANANVSAPMLARMGAAMVAVIDQLETRGRRVELSVTFCAESYKGRQIMGWQVKQAQDQPNLADIAYSVSHPAAMRRIGFAMQDRAPGYYELVSRGTATALRPGELPYMEDVLVINGLATGSRPGSVASAAHVLASQLNEAAGYNLVDPPVKL
jgi:hypothetical protein